MKTRGAYGYALATRVIGAAGGLLTAELIARHLDKVDQGYYYSFLSLLGTQLVMEMGLATLLVVRSSHHARNLEWDGRGLASPPPSDLVAMFRGAVRWYLVLALVSWLMCSAAGPWLLGEKFGKWGVAWLVASLAAGIQVATQPFVATLEGCGKVTESTRIRLLQTIGMHVGACSGLVLGGGLLAVGSGYGMMLLMGVAGLWRWRRLFYDLLRSGTGGHVFSWWRDLWPAQWRLGFVGVTVFCIGSLPTLLILKHCGETMAGEWGMARRMFETILFAGAAMFTTRTAVFGSAFAQGQLERMTGNWRRTMVRALVLTAGAAAAAPVVLRVMAGLGFHFPERMGLTSLHVVLAVLTVVNCANWGVEVFVRSAGTEPYLVQSLARTVVTVGLLAWIVPTHGAYGAAWVLLVIAAVMILPWNCGMIRATIRRWRAQALALPQPLD